MGLTFQKGQGDKIFITKLTQNAKSVKVFSVNDVEYYNDYFTVKNAEYDAIAIRQNYGVTLPSDLLIPSNYKGQAITSLYYNAFDGSETLRRVTIQEGIDHIGLAAFKDCINLEEIIIPDGVDNITNEAFKNCISLVDIVLPDSVRGIPVEGFSGCSKLSWIVIPANIGYISKNAFNGCINLNKVYYKGTANDWGGITGSEEGNECLANATCYYYSETKPTTEGNYWHYVDGEIFEWDGSACEGGHTWVKTMCSTGSVCTKCGKLKGDVGECTWGELEITIRQNCTEAGQARRMCSVCGAKRVENCGTPLGHDYGDWIVLAPPTCTEDGCIQQQCLRCGDIKTTDSIPALGHDWGEWVLDEEDQKEHRECSACHEIEERLPLFVYELLEDGTYSVKAGDGLTGVIEIPSSYKGEDVTQIAEEGFKDEENITSVILPDTVTSIGGFAFYSCPKLVSLVIPKSVIAIGDIIINNYSESSFTTVYYGGTESDWADITIGSANYELNDATIYYYSETEPTAEGNYWHYVDGKLVVWCKHNIVTDEAVAPTCTESGLTEGSHCSICGEVIVAQEIIPATGNHKWVEADCENPKTCIVCGETEGEPLGGHVASDWIIDKEATLTTDGKRHKECIHCGAVLEEGTYSMAIDFDNPTPYSMFTISTSRPNEQTDTYAIWAKDPYTVLSDTILPRYTSDGSAEIYHIGESAFQDAYYLTRIGIPKTIRTIDRGAFYGSRVQVVVFEEGSQLERIDNRAFYGCSLLKKIDLPSSVKWICEGAFNGTAFEEIYLSKNVITLEPRVFADMPSNCTVYVEAESKPEGWADDWCDDSVTVVWGYTEGGESCSHSYGGWTTTTRPTCSRFGSMQRICSICGNVDVALIDPLDHEYETVVTEPTCTARGYTDYICKRCGTQLRKDYTNSLGHEWDEGFVRIEPTCTTNGVRRHTCTRCGDTVEVGISALRHDWGEWSHVHPVECEIDGTDSRYCKRCGEEEIQNVPATGHDWDVEVEVVEPTCTDGGYTIHKCNNCAETYIDAYTDPLGHNIVDGVCTRCDNDTRGVVYYGVSAIPERYNSAFVLGLDQKVPSNSHLNSISATPLEGEYIYYCAPTAFGDCAFAYNNFIGGFSLIIEGLALTNEGGKTESYNIYKSNQANLGANGAITITIKE